MTEWGVSIIYLPFHAMRDRVVVVDGRRSPSSSLCRETKPVLMFVSGVKFRLKCVADASYVYAWDLIFEQKEISVTTDRIQTVTSVENDNI